MPVEIEHLKTTVRMASTPTPARSDQPASSPAKRPTPPARSEPDPVAALEDALQRMLREFD